MYRRALLVLIAAGLGACTRPSAPPEYAPASHPAHVHGEEGFHHRFDNAEKWAERFDDPARDAWQRPSAVVSAMGLEPGSKVADLGAGTGYFLPHLTAAVGPEGSVVGLDVEEDMVEYMRARIEREKLEGASARRVAPEDPSLEPGGLDAILIVDTWHHISSRSAYAEKLAAGLAPGGAVFVVDFTLDAPEGPPKAHRLPLEKVMAELQAGGLQAERLTLELPRQYMVRARKPVQPQAPPAPVPH